MSAVTPKNIHHVYSDQDVVAHVVVRWEDGTSTPLNDCPKPALVRVASYCAKADHFHVARPMMGQWLSATNDQLIDYVERVLLCTADRRVGRGGEPTDVELPIPATIVEPPVLRGVESIVAPMAPPVTPPADDVTSLLTQLGALLSRPAVDVDQVKAIVTEQMDSFSTSTVEAVAQLVDNKIAAITAPINISVDLTTDQGATTKTVEGAHPLLTEVLGWVKAKRHPFLIGPAGCGKTTLAEQLATALDLPFYTDGQLSNEYQLLGFVDAAGHYHPTPLRQAVEHGGVYLADEFDGWDESAALALHQVTSNGHMTFPDSPTPIKRHAQCVIILAGNTWGHGADREYVGRNQMDGATLSRVISLTMDYDKGIERAIAGEDADLLALVWRMRENVRRLGMRHLVGTRELGHCVAGIGAGLDRERVIATCLRRNLSDTDWAKVTA